MIDYLFITSPAPGESTQLLTLYKTQNWWTKDRLTPDYLRLTIQNSHCYLIAKDKGIVIGMGRAISDGTGDAYLHDICVSEAYRKKGIGTAIVKTIMARLKRNGITWFGLIAENRTTSIYSSSGFKPFDNAVPMQLFLKQ